MESSYPIHATLLWFDTILLYILYFVGAGVVCGGLSAWIAGEKNRGFGEGLLLGFLFGPLGVLVEALLPSGSPPEANPEGLAACQNQWVNKPLRKVLVVIVIAVLSYAIISGTVSGIRCSYRMDHAVGIVKEDIHMEQLGQSCWIPH